ncbi:MAG: hypothetical protein R2695_20210 [Acidimicrobiales bacterium]
MRALEFFSNQPVIARHADPRRRGARLRAARSARPDAVGRGGCSGSSWRASWRSGRPATPSTLLDEPTTGLHFEDIRKLLHGVLGRLVDQGNTVLVIEHNLDVVKTDWLIVWARKAGPEAVRSWWQARPRTWPPPPKSHRSVPGAVARLSRAAPARRLESAPGCR